MKVRRAWLRWLGVGTGSLALVMVALWTQRAPIAQNFVGRELNRRGVQARYDLVDVGLRTQRIENIILGNPLHPDLTAKWVEVDVAFTGLTPRVAAVRAGGVRLRGSWRKGVLRLGQVDKLRSGGGDTALSLPDLMLTLADARISLDTDAGPVGIQIDGAGNLQSGFRGAVAAAMPNGSFGGCGVARMVATVDVVMDAGVPHISGPVRANALGCSGADAAIARPAANVDVTIGWAFDQARGHIDLTGEALKSRHVTMARPDGRIDFDFGSGFSRGAGRVEMKAAAMAAGGASIRDVDLKGDWTMRDGEATLKGNVAGTDLRQDKRNSLATLRHRADGTPVGPIVRRFVDAVANVQHGNRIMASFAAVQRGDAGSLSISDAHMVARSGARVGLAADSQLTLGWPRAGGGMDWSLNGSLTTGGGGFPTAALRLARRTGGGFGGQLFVDEYAAQDARLGLDTVRFSADANGVTRFSTSVQMSGPLTDGYVRGLSLPVSGSIAPGGQIAINPDCVGVAVADARYGGFTLSRVRQRFCPLPGSPMLAVDREGVRGGVSVRQLALDGSSGSSPMHLRADRANLTLGRPGFDLNNAIFTVGPESAPVRLAAGSMSGMMASSGFAGTLKQAGGQIGTVPLIAEDGEGKWRFDRGVLSLDAAMRVHDSQMPQRFVPLAVPDFSLRLKDGRIAANGTLHAPRADKAIAKVDIVHDLSRAVGHADLSVAGLTFNQGLQPEDITPLTLGVVANVNGTVRGNGRIDWAGSDVRSTGTFSTDNSSLAAAFGPVEGLSGTIRFTDLIGMVTAPGQEVRIGSANPGVEVKDGVVRYRLEPGQKVRIEGGGWPFSGGQLVLLPTTMDFSADVDRYMTFRVIGLDAGAFIQAMELENISATGTFDGIMPLIFSSKGGRVAGGVLVARQDGMPPLIMPEGVLPTIPCDNGRQGGTLSYVGPVSNEDVGVMGKIAFDALKNLQYKCLTILMDGALDGEMVTNVVFNGVNRDRLGSAPAGLARSFVGLPFIFNVKISAPFRGLMKTAKSYIDPTETIRDEIGRQTQEKMRDDMSQPLAVQPAESDIVPDGKQR